MENRASHTHGKHSQKGRRNEIEMRAVAVRSRSILLSLAAAMCRPVAGIITTSPPTILRARSVVTARSPLNMQYGYVGRSSDYGALQQGYGDQQNYIKFC